MADELVRYDFEQAWSEGGTAAGLDLVARDSGHWVRYQDYAALEASCAAMRKALDACLEELAAFDGCRSEGCTCGDGWEHCDPMVIQQGRAALTQANGEGGRDGGTTSTS